MKRIAIPVFDDHLSEYFGSCSYFVIFETDNLILKKEFVELPMGIEIGDLPEWFEKQGVTDVIAYKLNKQIISLFASRKVNLFVGISLRNPEMIIDDYLKGKLESDKKIIAELIQNEN